MELVNALQAFESAGGDGGRATRSAPRSCARRSRRRCICSALLPARDRGALVQLGHRESLFKQRWPVADPAALHKTEVTVVVQVDGKVRGRLLVDVDAADDQVRQLALGDDRVRPWLERRRVEKVVVVPNRLVNIVTRA